MFGSFALGDRRLPRVGIEAPEERHRPTRPEPVSEPA
jgi:hypothetical protein